MNSWFKADVLQGKTALVIGGSSESGPIVCQTLVEHGANLAFTYLTRQKEAEKLAAQLSGGSAKVQAIQFDLFDIESIPQLVKSVAKDFGSLDILVLLGGPAPIYTNLREISVADFDTMIDSHFKANFILSIEAAKIMEQAKGGTVINVSATSCMKYSHGLYGLTKACQREATGFLASTFAPNVRFFTLIPGLIELEETDLQLRLDRKEMSPLKKNISIEEIAQLIISACSPAFANVTGQSLIADGGFFMLHP